jgi:septum formation protein
MRPIERAAAVTYVATGEPLDKAGAYALQGEGVHLVAEVEGSRSNVMGLPLEAVVPALDRAGVSRSGAIQGGTDPGDLKQ